MDFSIEPDDGRDSPYRRQIVSARPMLGTTSGQWLLLECGHRTASFGDLALLKGGVICTQCRDEEVA